MKQRTVTENEAGQRMDKLLLKLFCKAQKGFLYKMLRKKNITLNGNKAEGNEILQVGNIITIYFADETYANLTGSSDCEVVMTEDSGSSGGKKQRRQMILDRMPEIVYEDKHIIIMNKPAGLLSQKALPEDISLVEYVLEYLFDNGTIREEQLQTFRPGICNRLDRNTSGLVIAGKTLPGLQKMSELLRERSLQKFYLCIVKGEIQEERKIIGYLTKNEKTNTVTVQMCENMDFGKNTGFSINNFNKGKTKTAGDLIETAYRPLKITADGTLLEVELITGKSHQIRAHLASIGHPIAGDLKYGDTEYNRQMKQKYGAHHQMLHAWRMIFPDMESPFENLAGREVKAECPKEIQEFIKRTGDNYAIMEFKRASRFDSGRNNQSDY